MILVVLGGSGGGSKNPVFSGNVFSLLGRRAPRQQIHGSVIASRMAFHWKSFKRGHEMFYWRSFTGNLSSVAEVPEFSNSSFIDPSETQSHDCWREEVETYTIGIDV